MNIDGNVRLEKDGKYHIKKEDTDSPVIGSGTTQRAGNTIETIDVGNNNYDLNLVTKGQRPLVNGISEVALLSDVGSGGGPGGPASFSSLTGVPRDNTELANELDQYIPLIQKNVNNGVSGIDSAGRIIGTGNVSRFYNSGYNLNSNPGNVGSVQGFINFVNTNQAIFPDEPANINCSGITCSYSSTLVVQIVVSHNTGKVATRYSATNLYWSNWTIVGDTIDWEKIINVPSEFPPKHHLHNVEDITGLRTLRIVHNSPTIYITATEGMYDIQKQVDELLNDTIFTGQIPFVNIEAYYNDDEDKGEIGYESLTMPLLRNIFVAPNYAYMNLLTIRFTAHSLEGYMNIINCNIKMEMDLKMDSHSHPSIVNSNVEIMRMTDPEGLSPFSQFILSNSTLRVINRHVMSGSVNNGSVLYMELGGDGDDFLRPPYIQTNDHGTVILSMGYKGLPPNVDDSAIIVIDQRVSHLIDPQPSRDTYLRRSNTPDKYYGTDADGNSIMKDIDLTAVNASIDGLKRDIFLLDEEKLDMVTTTSDKKRMYVVNEDGTQGMEPVPSGGGFNAFRVISKISSTSEIAMVIYRNYTLTTETVPHKDYHRWQIAKSTDILALTDRNNPNKIQFLFDELAKVTTAANHTLRILTATPLGTSWTATKNFVIEDGTYKGRAIISSMPVTASYSYWFSIYEDTPDILNVPVIIDIEFTITGGGTVTMSNIPDLTTKVNELLIGKRLGLSTQTRIVLIPFEIEKIG